MSGLALLPCPFCGGEAEFERRGTRRVSCIVACTDCGARHESSDEDERSGCSWNDRSKPAVASSAERKPCGAWRRIGEEWELSVAGMYLCVYGRSWSLAAQNMPTKRGTVASEEAAILAAEDAARRLLVEALAVIGEEP